MFGGLAFLINGNMSVAASGRRRAHCAGSSGRDREAAGSRTRRTDGDGGARSPRLAAGLHLTA